MKTIQSGEEKISLEDIETEAPNASEEEEKREKTKAYVAEIDKYQQKLYAEGQQSLLILFQGLDGSGKDGLTRNVIGPLNPQGVVVTSFKSPEPHELKHDFLWRVHQVVPAKGMIGVFNRSHYEDVLIARIKQLVPGDVWKKRFGHINAFESLLADNGVRILKFYLHISKKEQRKRFDERINTPEKRWKYDPADEQVQMHWDEYIGAYEDVFKKCSTDAAPWHIVPSDNKWYRDYAVAKTICKTLEDMGPKFPVI